MRNLNKTPLVYVKTNLEKLSEVDTSLAKEISEHTRLQPNVFVVPFIVSLRAPYALNTILEPLEILLLRRLVQKTPPMNPILPTNCPQSTLLLRLVCSA